MKKFIWLLIATGLVLGGCSSTVSQPASVDVATLAAEVTAADSDVLEDEEWHGIPIMAEAINAEGNAREYRFSVSAPAEAIQAFYNEELELRGFTYSIPGGRVGPEADNESNGLPIVFTGKRIAFSIVIIPSGEVSDVILRLLRGSTY